MRVSCDRNQKKRGLTGFKAGVCVCIAHVCACVCVGGYQGSLIEKKVVIPSCPLSQPPDYTLVLAPALMNYLHVH